MQVIEANRHCAEGLEQRAALCGYEGRTLAAIAAQRREIADQLHALAVDGKPSAVRTQIR
jgi:hypothetical protein